ncbi:MAG: Bacterial proteasome-activating AAA-ATPase (PAN), partial [uncultured Nocardioides sp.]
VRTDTRATCHSGALPGGRGHRPAPPPGRRARSLARAGDAPRRHAAIARRGVHAERAARPDPARRPRPDHQAEGGGRPARSAAGRLRHVPGTQRRRLRRRLHRRSQAAGQRQPRCRPRPAGARPGGHAQRGPQRRGRLRLRAGRRGRDVQGAA